MSDCRSTVDLEWTSLIHMYLTHTGIFLSGYVNVCTLLLKTKNDAHFGCMEMGKVASRGDAAPKMRSTI